MPVSELKPCPFCGGDAEWNLGKKGDDTPWRYIACSDCEAMGPHVEDWELSKVAADNDAVLIAAWNRRAALSQGALEPAFIEAMAAEYTRLAWSSAPLSTWPAADRELIIDRFRQSYLAALAATPPSSQGAPEWRALLTEARNEIDHYADTAREHDLVARIDAALAAPPEGL